MSDEETSPNNAMDTNIASNETSSPSVQGLSNIASNFDIVTGHISGSDDEEINEPTTSKSSTPDSTILSKAVTKKLLTTNKHPLTKTKSSLVNYERDSDDDEHTDEEDEEENNEEQDVEDKQSNSNSADLAQATGDLDIQTGTIIISEQTIVTSDLLTVTPLKTDDVSSPSSRPDITPIYPLIFPEDADIRIPPEPSKPCPAKLEKKFEDYYKRFKRTGVDQNALIQELKDFRNPCMYEKIISHLDIDEIGTNFPHELYNPHWWGKESYYEELSKAQKLEMDRREKERRERTKIGFTPGVKKVEQLGISTLNNSDTIGEKRKTRFDQ